MRVFTLFMMRVSKVLSVILLSVLIVSCGQKDEKRQLNRIEELWAVSEESPAMADSLLCAFKDSIKEPSSLLKARTSLLEVRLRENLHKTPTSDDSIKTLTNYFTRHGNKTDQMRAYYYMACTYWRLHDSPRAMTNYLTVLNLFEKENGCDSLIAQHCYSRLAHMQILQKNVEESLRFAEQGLALTKERVVNDPRVLMDVVTALFLNKDSTKAFSYCEDVTKQIVREKSYVENADILIEILSYYSHAKKKEEADKLISQLNKISASKRHIYHDWALAIYHDTFFSPDSALNDYIRFQEKATSNYDKYAASSWLMDYFYDRKDWKNTATSARAYKIYNILYQNEQQYELTRNARGEYLYYKDKEEEEAAFRKASRLRFLLLSGIALLSITLLCVLLFYSQRRKKMLEDILSKEKRIDEISSLIRLSQTVIDQKETELATLNKDVERLETELRERKLQNRRLLQQSRQEEFTAYADEVISKFRKAAEGQYHLQESDWSDLRTAVDALYPDYLNQIQEKMKRPSTPLLQTCYLMKIGMTTAQIEHVMDVSRQTAWNRVKRIEEILS